MPHSLPFLFDSSMITHSSLSHFLPFSFFVLLRPSPSLSPYITPRLRRFLPQWAHPWKVSLIGADLVSEAMASATPTVA